jgi:hypothetical protein
MSCARERDGVSDWDGCQPRSDPLQVPKERVLGVLRLLEWVLDPDTFTRARVDRIPRTPIDFDSLSTLDLQHEQPSQRMEDHEVGLSVTLAAVALGLPSDGVEHAPGVVELSESCPYCRLGRVVIEGFLREEPRHDRQPTS